MPEIFACRCDGRRFNPLICCFLHSCCIAWLLLFLFSPLVLAKTAVTASASDYPLPEATLPPLQVYLPSDYQAHGQNWAMLQTADGRMIFGNSDGVLIFDGVHWRLIRLPNRSIVRSLALDAASGRVYVGAVGEFGYLQTDANGLWQYQSLLAEVPQQQRDFADVWFSAVTDQGVVFSTYQRLFRFGPQGLQSWTPGKSFHRCFWVNGQLLIREDDVGLLRLEGDQLVLQPKGERFAKIRINNILAVPDEPDTLLIVTRQQGFFRYHQGELLPQPTDIDEVMHQQLSYETIQLLDGRIVVATLQNGVYLLDRQGRWVGSLNRQYGLPNNAVYKMFEDRQGGVWFGTNRGLARAQYASPLTMLTEQHGLLGSVYLLGRYQGRLYAGTSEGLYQLQPGPEPKLTAVPGILGQVWAMQPYANQLLLANYQGLYRLTAEGAAPVALGDSLTNFLHLPAPQDLLLVAGRAGVQVFTHIDGQVVAATPPSASGNTISQLGYNVRSMLLENDRVLWLGTLDSGVIRLEFPKGQLPWGKATVLQLTEQHGLPAMNDNQVVWLDGKVRIKTAGGLFRFDEVTQRLGIDPSFAQMFTPPAPDPDAMLTLAQGALVYARFEQQQRQEVGFAMPQADGNYQWQPIAGLKNQWFVGMYQQQAAIGEPPVFWLGGDRIYRYQPAAFTKTSAIDKAASTTKPSFRLMLHQLRAGHDFVRFFDTDQSATEVAASHAWPPLILSYPQRQLQLKFAATDYDGPVEFSHWLDGVETQLSEWSTQSVVDYPNVREGSYQFQLQARNSAGTVVQMAPMTITILPPWYRHPVAYAGYLVLLLMLAELLHLRRTRSLKLDTERLERQVTERTAELVQAKSQVEQSVTELQQTLDTLKSTQSQLIRSEKLAALGQLVAGVAHEVNTPLGVALTGISFLREETQQTSDTLGAGQLSKTALQHYLQTATETSSLIERNLLRAGDLVSNFKQVSVDRSSGDRRQFELQAMLQEVTQSLATLWKNRPIELQIDCPSGMTLDSYPGTLGQVLTILVQNSLHHAFGPEQAGQMQLQVRMLDQDQLELRFRDDGAGIAEQDAERVFEPFFTTRRNQGCTGLGLNILFNLVTVRLGGKVELVKQAGTGSCFVLVLPRVAPTDASDKKH